MAVSVLSDSAAVAAAAAADCGETSCGVKLSVAL